MHPFGVQNQPKSTGVQKQSKFDCIYNFSINFEHQMEAIITHLGNSIVDNISQHTSMYLVICNVIIKVKLINNII